MNTPSPRKNKNEHKTRDGNGFTLFIALIVSSLMLLVGFSIAEIVVKQLVLAGASTASQTAFYAADGGLECALYWNYRDATGAPLSTGPFATSTVSSSTYNYINCGFGIKDPSTFNGNGNVLISKVVSGVNYATTTFFINMADVSPPVAGLDSNACAMVVVAIAAPTSTIYSRGYNAPYNSSIGCDTSNPRTVERGLQATF